MQEGNQKAINRLWDSLIRMIGWIVMGIVGVLIYLPMEADIKVLFDEPQHSQSELHQRMLRRSALLQQAPDRIEKGIHLSTGLIYDQNFELVKNNCTSCHSAKLITQNRATREGWQHMIRWMQATQNLHDLGSSEQPILDYLSTHYAPQKEGRRKNLDMEAIAWYVLDLE